MSANASQTRITELGEEKRCTLCGDFWPADEEFFYRRADSGRLTSWCRACQNAHVNALHKARRAAFAEGGQ